MKVNWRRLGGTFLLAGFLTLGVGATASYANVNSNELDSIQGYDAVEGNVTNGGSGGQSSEQQVNSTNSVTDYMKGQEVLTSENMETGSYWAAPITAIIGNLAGFIVIIILAYQALQTGIDLLYWGIPPLRGLLAKQNPTAAQGGGMMGGFGGAQQESKRSLVAVSDDMLQAMETGGNVASQGGMNAGFGGGGGFGSGGFGMGAMGGQPERKKSHILVSYFKKRVVSLIVLGLCFAILFSSILVDTGINIGAFVFKLIEMFNQFVTSNT